MLPLTINQNSREWIEARTRWIVDQFGLDRIRNLCVVLPDEEWIQEYRRRTDDEVRRLVGQISDRLGLDSELIDIEYFCQPENPVLETRALGLYESVGGRFKISISEDSLSEPYQLIATLAHELCHIHLLGHHRLTEDEFDHELVTDLLTLFLGFGVFTSNSSLFYGTGRNGYAGGSVGRQGYLSMHMYGYAWALFASIRGEDGSNWKPHLRADVRDACQKSQKWLIDQGGFEYKTPTTVGMKPRPAYDQIERNGKEVVRENKPRCSYCNARLPLDYDTGVCDECNESMEVNRRELQEDAKADERDRRFAVPLFLFSLSVIFLLLCYAILSGR